MVKIEKSWVMFYVRMILDIVSIEALLAAELEALCSSGGRVRGREYLRVTLIAVDGRHLRDPLSQFLEQSRGQLFACTSLPHHRYGSSSGEHDR